MQIAMQNRFASSEMWLFAVFLQETEIGKILSDGATLLHRRVQRFHPGEFCFRFTTKLSSLFQLILTDQYEANCNCIDNCEDIKFNMKSSSYLAWLRGNTLRWEMNWPKFRIKREVIYAISDVLGKRHSIANDSRKIINRGFISSAVAAGATFGLFLGISFLSVTRLLYYFCFRRCLRRIHNSIFSHRK